MDEDGRSVENLLIDRELIGLVHSNPVLWDKRLKQLKKDRESTDLLWNQIGQLLSTGRSGEDVQIRWKSLRDQYTRELRKERRGETKAGAGEEGYVSKWPHFKELEFLRGLIKPRSKKCQRFRPEPDCSSSEGDSNLKAAVRPNAMQGSPGLPCSSAEPPEVEAEVVVGRSAWDTSSCESTTNDTECEESKTPFKRRRKKVVPHFETLYWENKKANNVSGMIKSAAENVARTSYALQKSFQGERSGSGKDLEDDVKPILSVLEIYLKKVPQAQRIKCFIDILVVLDKHLNGNHDK